MCDGNTCTPKLKKALEELFESLDDVIEDIEN
jgi:hypothetical protein